jgi:hypothetical protein
MEASLRIFSIACFLFILVSSVFAAQTASTKAFENKGDWETFERNRSILGLTAGETPMKKVFALFGDAKLSRPRDPHDTIDVCFKSVDDKLFVVLVTGYLHDDETLDGFAISAKQPAGKTCVASKYIKGNPETAGGINLQITRASVLGKLGKPSSEEPNELRWEFQYYEKYIKPKVGISEAGPTGARYLLKGTAVGAYHHAWIVVRFENNRITSFEVEDDKGGEDGFLEHLPLEK